jgi:hypothetical protein
MKKIIESLKEVGLYNYYKEKDIDKEENEESIYLLDIVVLKDDVEDILNNIDEYADSKSVYYQEELEFIEQIKKLKNSLF